MPRFNFKKAGLKPKQVFIEKIEKEEPREFFPHKYQEAVLKSDKRFILCVAGIQGGKTLVGAVWMLREALKEPDKNHLIVAPTYKMLGQSTLEKFFDFYGRRRFSAGKYEFTILGGKGKIFVRSGEEPKKLEAMTLKSVWIDEGGMMADEVWSVINGRLAIEKGRLLVTTTPRSFNWVYTELYKRWISGDKDYDVVQFRSIDNPYFPHSEFERAKETFSESEFLKRYCGEFRKEEGLVYAFRRDEHTYNSQGPIGIIKDYQIAVCGLDLGYTQPTAFVRVVIKDGIFYVTDAYYKRQGLIKEHAHKIAEITGGRAETIYVDPSEKQAIEELRRYGLNVYPARVRDINLGIDRIKKLLEEKRIKVNEKCRELIHEFENYHYGLKDIENYKDKPEKVFDHGLDALRYAVSSLSSDVIRGKKWWAEEGIEDEINYFAKIKSWQEGRRIGLSPYTGR